MNEWIKRKCSIYTVDLKKKEILPYATIRMSLEDMMLSEISQTQKDEGCGI